MTHRRFWMFWKAAALLLMLASLLNPARVAAQEIIDILLKNGHVIDPKNERNGRYDIAIVDDKIFKVAKDIPASHAKRVIDVCEF